MSSTETGPSGHITSGVIDDFHQPKRRQLTTVPTNDLMTVINQGIINQPLNVSRRRVSAAIGETQQK